MILAALALSLNVDAFLCDTPRHATQFAAAVAQGESVEMAKDAVGRLAQKEVCGLYRGNASIASEQIVLEDGIAYKLTQLRFAKDNRVAWLAERTFAPTEVTAELHT